MEIVVALRIAEDSAAANNYDNYTCRVIENSFHECLDIASPRTLSSSINGSYGIDAASPIFSWMGSALNTSSASYFGGSETTCDGKVVGDGTVNTFDVAVFMWYNPNPNPIPNPDPDPDPNPNPNPNSNPHP